MKSGFVSIIGRPNVGKSTLLDHIIKMHVAITSNKPGTTRNVIQGIYNDNDSQIVFVDTPGFTKEKNKLGKLLNKQAQAMLLDVDLILFLVDGSTNLGEGDKAIMKSLEKTESPVILVINKIDKIKQEEILLKISEYKDMFPFVAIIPISALNENNISTLIEEIKKYLTDDMKYFDESTYTTSSVQFMASEYVREKLLEELEQEIPHRITCVTEKFEETEDLAKIFINIIVDKDSLKKIIIGKKGERIKRVGIKARNDIEKLIGKKVYLELFVKTIPNWLDKEKYLLDLGFKDFE